jgi:hypothetical protein
VWWAFCTNASGSTLPYLEYAPLVLTPPFHVQPHIVTDIDTPLVKFGDLGSMLPKQPSGTVWKAGSTVDTMWAIRANHGGGYQYRLCPVTSNLTEECFQKTPMPFAGACTHAHSLVSFLWDVAVYRCHCTTG